MREIWNAIFDTNPLDDAEQCFLLDPNLRAIRLEGPGIIAIGKRSSFDDLGRIVPR